MGKLTTRSMDVSFLLVVRGGRNEKGVMLLLPRLTPSVPAFSLCLHRRSSLPWAPVAYGWCQCILQLQQELKAQDRLHAYVDLLQNASWCRQRFLPGVRRGKAEHRARGGVVDAQSVSLLVPVQIFMVSILESVALQGQTVS